ncbi:hypothetical protein V1506DRAFT_515495 [Lipomyces tetrasporus]
MENKMMPDRGLSAAEMTSAQTCSKADDLLTAPSGASDNPSADAAVGSGQNNGSESATTKTKKPAPLGVKTNRRSTAAAAVHGVSSSSSSSSRPLTAASTTRTTTARAPTSGSSSRENATPSNFTVASRLLAPTAASKAHAAAGGSGGAAEPRAPVRRGARASAPTAVGHSTGPVQRFSTKQPPAAVAARPFGAAAASSSTASTNATSVVQRDVKAAATLRHESVHTKPARPLVRNVKGEATLGQQGQRKAAEELVLAEAENAQKAAAAEREKSQAGLTERDNKISELSAELEATTTKLQDSTSLTQQQADSIAVLQAKHSGFEDKITALEKELADANQKHDAALANLQIELTNSKQLHSTEVENAQSQVSADKKKYEEEIASLSQKLASAEEQINLRERELLGNSKVIKSLQDELNTIVETLEDAKEVELEKLAKSYDGWRDKDYVGGLEKELETLKVSLKHDTEAASLKQNIADLKAKNLQQKDLIAALETKVEVLTATIASQGELNTKLSASNADLASEDEGHVRQLSETNQKLQEVLAQQSQLEAMAAVLQSEKANSDKNVADMRQIFGELERNVDSLNSEFKM